MKKPESPPDPPTRKSVALPESMWREIEDFRFGQRIRAEAEAVRRLLRAGLDAVKKGPKK